jgi:hypothetical protein
MREKKKAIQRRGPATLPVSATGETLAPPHQPSSFPPFPCGRRRAWPGEARTTSVVARFLLLPAWTRGGAGRSSMAGSRAPRWSLVAGTSGSSGGDVARRGNHPPKISTLDLGCLLPSSAPPSSSPSPWPRAWR